MFIIDFDRLNECDGGAAAGGDAGGASGGGEVSAAPGGAISTGDVLGHCDHDGDNKAGYMGHGCFHMPFPFKPVLYRYGWGTDGSKGKKGRKPKNPYVGKIKTIVGESEDGKAFEYQGDALKEFKNITQAEDGEVVLDVLSYNGALGVAWKVDSKDGLLKIYTPWQMDSGKWTVSASHLTPDCKIEFDYKGGRYPTREAALDAVWKAAEDHKKKLNEFVGENRVLEEGKKIPDSVVDRFEKFSDEEIDAFAERLFGSSAVSYIAGGGLNDPTQVKLFQAAGVIKVLLRRLKRAEDQKKA